jgi:hypothetical protein
MSDINLSQDPAFAVTPIHGRVAQAVWKMKKGSRICYHVGYLPIDRKNNDRIGAMANDVLAMGAPEHFRYSEEVVLQGLGAVSLTQKRLGYQVYAYYMTKN